MNCKIVLGTLAMGLTLLGSSARAENPEHMRQLMTTGDCPGCDLSGVSLISVNLSDANLEGANLSGTRFQQVQLNRANLAAADLSDAYFSVVDFTGANLQNASLSNAVSEFSCDSPDYGSTGSVADRRESCVLSILPFELIPEICDRNPELSETLLSEIDAASYPCQEENLAEYRLYASTISDRFALSKLSLRGADLSGANLQNSALAGADLSYATLTDANAADADLDYVRLFEAELTGLKNADIELAWENWAAVGDWLVAAQARAEQENKENQGRYLITNLSSDQLFYYSSEGRLSTGPFPNGRYNNVDDLYQFGILETNRPDSVVQYVVSRVDNLPSWLNVVSVEVDVASGNSFVESNVCESTARGEIAVADLPMVEAPDGFFNCPTGWRLIEQTDSLNTPY